MEDDRIVISSGPTITPESVASRTFATGFRGYDQDQVRTFLKRVADELSMVAAREGEIRESMQEALHRAAHPELDEESLTAALGEHAARLLTNARAAATDIVSEAETRAARIIGEAESKIALVRAEADSLLARRSEEAERLTAGLRLAVEADVRAQRQRARAEAESEVESARAQGREMVAEARALRERMLADLARRRRVAEVQIEQLRLARQRLLEAYGVVRRTVEEATSELTAADADAQPALAAAGRGRVPAPVEAEPEPHRPSTPGPPASAAPGPAESDDAAPAAGASSRPAGGNRGTNGGPGASANPREPARSGTSPTPAGPSAPPSGSAKGPAPARMAVPPARPLVAVPAPTEDAELVVREIARTPDGAERAVASPGDALSAVPPPAAKAADDGPVADAAPAADAAEAAPSPTGDPYNEATAVPQVDELFARMRAARSRTTARPIEQVDAEPPAAAGSTGRPASAEAPPAMGPEPRAAGGPNGAGGPARTTAAVTDESTRSRRDEFLEPLGADLVRQLKRVLQDEHNEVLDRLRQQRRAVPDAVLPGRSAQEERLSAVARPVLAEAARLGAASVAAEGDGREVAAREVDQWAAELATDLVEPLRDRLERALVDASPSADDDDPDPAEQGTPGGSVADRLSAGYRQCKSEQIEPVARHYTDRAYCRGAYAATPEGANLRWLLDDDGPCPDCDDNVLAGAQVKGEPFPTGQAHPPAHIGCRCLLAVTGP